MRFSAVNKEGTDVGFFDGGEGAKSGEFFDADFTAAGFSEASSVENFERLTLVFYLETIYIAGSSLAGADKGLLFFAKRIKKGGFSDVGATDEGDF